MTDFSEIADVHRRWASRRENRSVSVRRALLKRLDDALQDHGERLVDAVKEDLGRPELEAYGAELSLVVREIRYAIHNLRRWMRPRRVGLFGGRRIIPEPYGATLVIGPWNYPTQLSLLPAVSALAAGNGVTLKPSEHAPATAVELEKMLEAAFPPEAVKVVTGDGEVAAALVDAGYNKVFFTGSTAVGRRVAATAAEHLSDVTLELGGKSPAVVAADSDLKYAARRIAWGKFINAGQTCIAPDYVLVHESVADDLVAAIHESIEAFYGPNPKESPDFARIVNSRHFDRLTDLLSGAAEPDTGDRPRPAPGVASADREDRYFAPTVVRLGHARSEIGHSPFDHPLMKEEIFGPILPVIEWSDPNDVLSAVAYAPDPLAFYLFTRSRTLARRFIRDIPFGGGMVNDTILHVADPRLPFGGRGASGTGRYHGWYGFETFSHMKPVLIRRQGRTGSLRFPPYRSIPERFRKSFFGI